MARAVTIGVGGASVFRVKPLSAARRDGRLVNALSVDVEDYFQVQALARVFDRAGWATQTRRVDHNTHRLLDLFAAGGVSATFFVLAWVAERHPDLIRRIVADGHELASHGSAHVRADDQTPEELRRDLRHSKHVLEDIGGVPILGYRAPTFSIGPRNLWAFDLLGEEGYAYSSSVYPLRRDYYGFPDAPRFAFYPTAGGVEEYPLTTIRIGGRAFPGGGGGFFRLLPYALSRAAIAWVNRTEERPAIFYIHPWEIDPDQPRVKNVPLKSRVRHYLNLGRTESRLKRLIHDFAWDRLDRVFRPGQSDG